MEEGVLKALLATVVTVGSGTLEKIVKVSHQAMICRPTFVAISSSVLDGKKRFKLGLKINKSWSKSSPCIVLPIL